MAESTLTGSMTSTDNARSVAAVNQFALEAPTCPAARAWRWMMRLAGQVRRQYLSRLRPGYVARMRDLRRGECRCCGSCCDLTFHCPFLNPQRQCKRYDRRTLTCRHFPIDALDLRLTRVPCGHYFAPLPEGEIRANPAD